MSVVFILWLRHVKEYIRSKNRMIGSLGMPLFFILIMGFGLNSVLDLGTGYNYVEFLIPGMIAVSILFASVFSGIQIIWDKQFGFLKETLIAPVSRISIMVGQTLGGATVALIQGAILFIISFFVGASVSGVVGFFVGLVFMGLIGLSFTALGVSLASVLEDVQGFQLITNFVIFPLFFLSGALFPLTKAPQILQALAYINPLTYGVEGMRYGFLGTSQINPLLCFLVLICFTIIMLVLGGYLFKKIKV